VSRVASRNVDMVRQKAASPVQQIDGEEPASAGHEGAAIIRHRAMITPVRRNALRLLRPTGCPSSLNAQSIYPFDISGVRGEFFAKRNNLKFGKKRLEAMSKR
jgi:hypothetical protein